MKKVYGKFCSRHNEAVNFYKELHARDKRFQAFIRVNYSIHLHLDILPNKCKKMPNGPQCGLVSRKK